MDEVVGNDLHPQEVEVRWFKAYRPVVPDHHRCTAHLINAMVDVEPVIG